MSTVFVSTPNIVHEANCPNKTKTLNEAESKSRVTVCGVKSCPRLRICPRKLKKSLSSFFLNIFSHLQKKFALSRDTLLSLGSGLSAVEKLFRWVQIVRVTLVSKLLITFVFAQWWAFENVIVPRDQTLNEDDTLNLHWTPPLRKHFVAACARPPLSFQVIVSPKGSVMIEKKTHSNFFRFT